MKSFAGTGRPRPSWRGVDTGRPRPLEGAAQGLPGIVDTGRGEDAVLGTPGGDGLVGHA